MNGEKICRLLNEQCSKHDLELIEIDIIKGYVTVQCKDNSIRKYKFNKDCEIKFE